MIWLTRIKLVLISLLLSIISLYFGYISKGDSCYLGYQVCEIIAYPLLIFLPLLVISLFTYLLKDDVYAVLGKFISYWVLLSLLLIMVSPINRSDLSFFYKKTILLIMAIGLLIISLILILYKSFSKK